MDRTLLEAYLRTTYWIEAPEAWIPVRIGAHSAALDRLLATSGARCWAFLTSDNPGSRRLRPAENAARRQRLEAELPPARLPGLGIGHAGDWPPEISYFVPGLDRSEATAIGRRHGQVAVVCGVAGLPAELVPCGGDVRP